jgi:hypothetical protein
MVQLAAATTDTATDRRAGGVLLEENEPDRLQNEMHVRWRLWYFIAFPTLSNLEALAVALSLS